MAAYTNQFGTLETSRSVMLCQRCRITIRAIRSTKPGVHSGPEPRLFKIAQRSETWTGAHHIKDGSFVAAAQSEQRCYICYMLHQACPRKFRAYANLFRTFYEIRPQGDDQFFLRFFTELHHRNQSIKPSTQIIEHHGTFKIIPRDKLEEHLELPYKLTPHTDTEKCRDQLLSWLQKCESCHVSSCAEDRRTNSRHRIRLLNVSATLGSKVRLESFKRGTRHSKYVTMSHCWSHGKKVEPIKLTTQTEVELMQGISVTRLPQKFQDAVKIAKWLQVDFLWIDALCILQDSGEVSKKDWEEQSAVMGDIYAGSYCNIAATNADVEKGCFRKRPVEIVEPYLVNDPASEKEDTHVIGYDDFWCNSLQDTTLHNRAWVLQERLLSPRTIHLGQEQMFWECRQLKACEAYPQGIPKVFSNQRTVAWRQDDYKKNAPVGWTWEWIYGALGFGHRKPPVESLREAYTSWSEVVERYMECELTRGSDKLVAIAGIANKVKNFTKERYLAGLWETAELSQSLLWYVPVRNQANETPSERAPSLGVDGYRAPSWSWASIDARIDWHWPSKCEKTLIELKGSNVTINWDDIGTVKSAEMPLRGHLHQVQLRILNSNKDGSPKEDGSYILATDTDTDSSDSEKALDDFESSSEPIVFLDTPLLPERSMNVFLLPICTQWHDRTNYPVAEVAGLILRKYHGKGDDFYERIGVFGLDNLQNLGGSLGKVVREAANPANMKDITLV